MPEGRKVFLGKNDDADDETKYMEFTNKDGQKTRLRLSQEAYKALFDLMDGEIRKSQELKIKYQISNAVKGVWELVKETP